MFRARKPSVQRPATGKHVPGSGNLPIIKREPRAVVDDHIKPHVSPNPPANEVKPNVPPHLVSNFSHPKTSPLPLPSLPLSELHNHQHAGLQHLPPAELYDTDADVRYWEKRTAYKPWDMADDEDDDDDLIRQVRKDRKIPPESDPLLAQILAMFPEEGARQ